MTPPTVTDAPRRAPTAFDVEIEQHRIVYDVDDRSVRLLDPVGALIWSLLDGSVSLAELSGDLSAAFSVPKEQVTSDLASFVAMLEREGLLVNGRRRTPQPLEDTIVLPNPPSP